MPITPQQIKERKGEAVFLFGGETVHVEYMAAVVDALTQAQVEKFQEDANAATTPVAANLIVAKWLCEFVTKWDLLEDEGGPMFPLEPERMATLDGTFLARCFVEVVKDANQSKLGGMAS